MDVCHFSLPCFVCALSGMIWYYRYCPIPEEDFNKTILRPLYESENSLEPLAPHKMSVFWMVLAIGVLVDLDRPAHAPDAMKLYHYGRAALSIDSVLDEQSITGIQALVRSDTLINSICTNLDGLDIDAHMPLYVFVRNLQRPMGNHGYSGKISAKCKSSIFGRPDAVLVLVIEVT